jgi:hypothetical protein
MDRLAGTTAFLKVVKPASHPAAAAPRRAGEAARA